MTTNEPRKYSDKRKRQYQVGVRLTEEEHKILKEAAKKAGKTLPEFLRDSTLTLNEMPF